MEKVYIDEARVSSNTDKREALQEMLLDLLYWLPKFGCISRGATGKPSAT